MKKLKFKEFKKEFIYEDLPKFGIVFGLIGLVFPVTGLLMICIENPIFFAFFIPLIIFCSWALYQAFKTYINSQKN